jgi:hypothetical protein
VAARTGIVGLLVLRREDSETRNDFLGTLRGPTSGERRNILRGFWGVKGEGIGSLRGLRRKLGFYRKAEALRHPKTVKSIPLLAESAGNGVPGLLLRSRTTEILRWASLASRATPLPQDDNSFVVRS